MVMAVIGSTRTGSLTAAVTTSGTPAITTRMKKRRRSQAGLVEPLRKYRASPFNNHFVDDSLSLPGYAPRANAH